MNVFLKSVASVLEVEAIALDDDFRQVPDWCSLKGFGLLVMMENDWSAPLTVDRFLALRTVRDLYREAFVAFAAEVLKADRAKVANASYGAIPEWDSVAHLRLVMEAEKRFGTYYPIETIPNIKTIDDFLN